MIGKKGKTIILTLLFILIFCNFSYAAPLAESYYYPAAGVYKDMDVISSYISNSGYDSRVYEDTHGYYVRRTMNSDAIFYITTHGAIDPITKSGGGKINCYNSYGVQTSTVSPESIPLDDDNYSLKAYFGSNTSALNTIRLAYFSGCQTGVTHDEWGNCLRE